MNQIRAIQALNKREIENGVPPEASWHTDYRDTAFVYFGGLPYELSEGDVITIFSQFGEPVFLKLARDKETGRSKGFGWLKYEDQRSTDLAVDNLGGAEIGGRMVRVDHARYKLRDDEDPEECKIGWEDMLRRERAEKGLPSGDEDETDEEAAAAGQHTMPMLKEERELQLLIQNHDDDDPMKEFLIDEKKQEIEEALRREKRRSEKESRKNRDKDRHRHRSHRSRRDDSNDEGYGRDREKYRDRKNAAGILGTATVVEKAVRTETERETELVAMETTETMIATGKIVIDIGGTPGRARTIAASVDTGPWRIEDGTIGREVEAARRAPLGTKGAC
ncbi:hypothetical protein CHGG_06716 [Chaetomium globosum CBS 148.51]|uniref:RRM domain-containing protein n=1 Tax=Chaetomium globosum (strain ATCC 6205 / CBS 148.51 / DSM 1962 / NBRC 6347 / NRRL 1970) TaxID=306901 RepID=Q2H3P9_CHAGB|nr:uncharacterized protein CHGG_06716 [Chaetomium globosum CBS 148.51]EAQ90097.1 hypothetical protein CHGG_06716 [Chaetomium globosum CBS 148.51]